MVSNVIYAHLHVNNILVTYTGIYRTRIAAKGLARLAVL